MASNNLMAPEKFMFDRSFDTDQPEAPAQDDEAVEEVEEEPEVVLPSFSEEELEDAKKEAFEQGKVEALKESATAIENQIVDTTKAIDEKLNALIHEQKVANRDIFSDAIKVSQAITKKMFPSIIIEQSVPEIENVLRQILTQVMEEPRVTIHINPAVEDALNERIGKISTETQFEGRLLVTASDSIGEGDCTIEWSNGEAERNMENLLSEADAIIEDHLASLEGGYVPSPEAYDQEAAEQGESVDTSANAVDQSDVESDVNSTPENTSQEPQTASADTPAAEPEETDVTTQVGGPEVDQAQNSADDPTLSPETTQTEADHLTEAAEDIDTEPEKNSETNSSEGV